MPTDSSELCIRIVHHDSRTLVAVAGELDLSNKSVLRSHLDYVIADAPGDVDVDLAGVTYIDSSCLSEILGARTTLLDLGRDLRVTEASPQVARVFGVSGVAHLLDHSATTPA
jgi:anti-sigma B factor antagonist